MRSAEKALALAQKRLKDTHVTSPVNGFVQQRFVNSGEYTASSAKLLEVVDVHPLKLRTPVPERYARPARIGLPMQVEVDALPYSFFSIVNDTELIQYRSPVGSGPSSKTWPR